MTSDAIKFALKTIIIEQILTCSLNNLWKWKESEILSQYWDDQSYDTDMEILSRGTKGKVSELKIKIYCSEKLSLYSWDEISVKAYGSKQMTILHLDDEANNTK